MSEFLYLKFAVDIKKTMKKHGLSTRDVAILSGAGQATVARIARGWEKTPRMSTVLKIANSLDLDVTKYFT